MLFPFYSSERHSFLMEKWYFRLLFVFYIIGIIVSPVVFALVTWELLVESCLRNWVYGISDWDYSTICIRPNPALESPRINKALPV